MEPAAQAVLTMHPEPLERLVDLVACGGTIGSLLRFIRGDERPFRMLVEVVGGAVHLIRRENSPKEIIPDVRGYGHTFPDAYTTWDADVRGSASHQRILQYDFGGLGCIVRHEGDGYLKDKLGRSSKASRPACVEKSTVEGLIAGMDANRMNARTPGESSRLRLQSGGFEVPQSAIFDLKTRSMFRKGKDFLGEELSRLWVSQIPNFVLAYHERGTFTEIEVMDVAERVKAWEKSMNKELSQLAALLHHIVGLARASPDGRLEISRQLVNKLDIRAQSPGLSPAFSVEVRKKWESWLTANAKSDGGKGEEDMLVWSDGEGDYTACSEKCSYCGRCKY